MTSFWTRAGMSWPRLLRRIWDEIVEDEIFGRAAELAYYFLFSLFPLLLFLAALFAQLMGSRADLRAELFEYLEAVIPSDETLTFVRETVQGVIDQRGLPLSFGLVVSLWSAAQGIVAVGRVLDAAYDVTRKRPFWLSQLIAVGLTIGCALLSVTGLVLVFYGSEFADWLAVTLAWGGGLRRLWSWLQWPVVLLFVVLAFELIYNFAPAEVDRRRLHLTSPGAVVAVAVWLGGSLGLKAYLARFPLYNWAYGTLGAITLLLLWFYLTGFALLVGGEINSEIARALVEREETVPPPEPAPRSAGGRRGRRRRRGSK